MVRVEGTVCFVKSGQTNSNGANKSYLNLSITQHIPGYKPSLIDLTFWSDSKCFTDAAKLTEGSEVIVLANVAPEKKAGNFTGFVKYYPVEIVA